MGIAEVMKREGYILDFRNLDSKPTEGMGPQGWLEIDLKYGPEGEDVLTHLHRESKPGRRLYSKVEALPMVLNGLGISILSTSHGIMSDREARTKRIGGELLCTVYSMADRVHRARMSSSAEHPSP